VQIFTSDEDGFEENLIKVWRKFD